MLICSQCSAEIEPRRSADGDFVAGCENCGAFNLSWASRPTPEVRRESGGRMPPSKPDSPEVVETSGSLVGLLF